MLCFASAAAFAEESIDSGKLERTKTLIEESKSQEKKQQSAPEISTASYKMLQGLGLCCVLLMVGVYVAKKCKISGIAQGNRKMRLIERIALSPRSHLVLAEVEGRRVLLAVGSDNVRFHSLTDSDFFFAENGAEVATESNSSA